MSEAYFFLFLVFFFQNFFFFERRRFPGSSLFCTTTVVHRGVRGVRGLVGLLGIQSELTDVPCVPIGGNDMEVILTRSSPVPSILLSAIVTPPPTQGPGLKKFSASVTIIHISKHWRGASLMMMVMSSDSGFRMLGLMQVARLAAFMKVMALFLMIRLRKRHNFFKITILKGGNKSRHFLMITGR